MKHPYYHRSQELEWFSIGVRGVLCGGLHDTTERVLACKIKENDIIADSIVQFKGYHTIVDIINLYDKENMDSLYYSDIYSHGMRELDCAIKERLLVDIKKQINKVDKYWQLVCEYYPKILY